MMYDTVVIGGGQSGLASGYHLQKAGLSFIILEASEQPAGSWPHYYDSLRVFSPAAFSSLPGMPFPGGMNHYPTRDEVIRYLLDYARRFALPVQTSTEVTGVHKTADGFVIESNRGSFHARSVIAATGAFSRPHIPDLPGLKQFRGQVIHSARYLRPDAFVGQRIVVVGGGNSGVQIAVELAQVAEVSITTREPLMFARQRPLGQDVHFWWWLTGTDRVLPPPRIGGPNVLDTGRYRAAIQSGKPDWRPFFTRLTEAGIEWADGRAERVDTVLMATGFLPNLDYLRGLDALCPDGRPQHQGGVSSTVPGLAYVGLRNQRALHSATLRGAGRDAAYVIGHLKRHLRGQQPAFLTACCATAC
jgi:putative flavoprotein involved in K+ transport